MPSLPKHLKVPGRLQRFALVCLDSLNFYRVHLIAFTIVSKASLSHYPTTSTTLHSHQIPLVLSAIMWAVNTEHKIAYIDCLFNCFSAMTVTGLATVNLSTLSAVQQVIIFIQMLIGSPVRSPLVQIPHACAQRANFRPWSRS